VNRQLAAWTVAALAGVGLLAAVLILQHHRTGTRFVTFLAGDPQIGARLFEKKGCLQCHSVGGTGGRVGPPLGFDPQQKSSINQLVSAMWNHAPRMWDAMRQEKVTYPWLDNEEVAHLFSYLYTVRYVDEPGDRDRGVILFVSKGCSRCHAVRGQGGTLATDLSKLQGLDTPIVWSEAMWNHAHDMEEGMKKMGLQWPTFEGREMSDLLAYFRDVSGGMRRESRLLPANPTRGWEVFRSKQCIECHSVKGEEKRVGGSLGLGANVPLSIGQFAGAMWNHSPEMWHEMSKSNIKRPQFQGREMADLIAFLHGLRYHEGGGSEPIGYTLFSERGCAACHGVAGDGGPEGPTVRGRGKIVTSIGLAQALWRHGPRMYERTTKLGLPWPELGEADVQDLVIFLNSPPKEDAP
jgi:cytochrome c2